ncbi:LysR family transcriptional regulator (plasmid) [Paroceanicella profunda]|uniref:LysR family transcriptional regulator n=1 Tax=Paroceanicella profunda TaxID=2579971 RepID=A0A5B8G114_9RHOB|nr:LysR substrate-binding domain-containing protein [Paroceanicella profunda]QDL94405.1 LysR family transcriptional regulator [Paroceanicella profunda]
MSHPSLTDLEIFAAVARARGFRAAAARRGVAPSTLSDAVRRLEERLGQRLLHRSTRSVTPTEAGAQLLERISPALSELADALDSTPGPDAGPGGTLRLQVPEIVARFILPEIAARFLRAHPGIILEVTADNRLLDIIAEGQDAGIRFEEHLAQDMIAVPVGPRAQRYAAAATPEYLARHGTPRHPRDLLAHRILRHRFLNGNTQPLEFERGEAVLRIDPPARMVTNSLDMLLAACLAGEGIYGTFHQVLAPALAEGRLVPVLEDWAPRFPGPFLYYASRRLVPAPLRAFIDFLQAERTRG